MAPAPIHTGIATPAHPQPSARRRRQLRLRPLRSSPTDPDARAGLAQDEEVSARLRPPRPFSRQPIGSLASRSVPPPPAPELPPSQSAPGAKGRRAPGSEPGGTDLAPAARPAPGRTLCCPEMRTWAVPVSGLGRSLAARHAPVVGPARLQEFRSRRTFSEAVRKLAWACTER